MERIGTSKDKLLLDRREENGSREEHTSGFKYICNVLVLKNISSK